MVSHSEISLDALVGNNGIIHTHIHNLCYCGDLSAFGQVGALGSLPAKGCVFFKFEPFVLHMCCRTLEGARRNVRTSRLYPIKTTYAVI